MTVRKANQEKGNCLANEVLYGQQKIAGKLKESNVDKKAGSRWRNVEVVPSMEQKGDHGAGLGGSEVSGAEESAWGSLSTVGSVPAGSAEAFFFRIPRRLSAGYSQRRDLLWHWLFTKPHQQVDVNTRARSNNTHLHVLSGLPGIGGPHAIFRPRQNKQARGGFFSSCRLLGRGLRGIEGPGGIGWESTHDMPRCGIRSG